MDEILMPRMLRPRMQSGGLLREYVVIARRYRPQAFGELIGQEHVATGAGRGDCHQPRGARLSVHRRPRGRQDFGRPNSGQGA